MKKEPATRPRTNVGQALRELRDKRSLGQKQVVGSMSIQYSVRSYRRIEAGETYPDRTVLLRIVTEGLKEHSRPAINKILKLAKFAALSAEEIAELSAAPVPQLTRWGPVDGKPAGICIGSCSSGPFIPWPQLKHEIMQKLLPQVRLVPVGSIVSLGAFRGRANWIIRVLNPTGDEIANIWFGPDPHENWKFDGLVRIGWSRMAGDSPEPVVWQILQRYSDGSYRRIAAYL
jgi:transcriptional regulator with XRE-family HTH domain